MVGGVWPRSNPPGGRTSIQPGGRIGPGGMYRPDELAARGASLVGVRSRAPESPLASVGGARRREVGRNLELDPAARLADAEPVGRPRRRAGDHGAVEAEEALLAQAGELCLVGPVVGAPG